MGGCASKSKDMDLHPTEVPSTPTNKPQAETIPQENNNGGETATAPLVDLSESNEPKQEAEGDLGPTSAVAPSKTAEAELKRELDPEPEPVPAQEPDHKSTTPDLTQAEKLESIAKESEDIQTKEDHPKTGADALKSDATPTPTSEDKSVAPVVAV